MRLETFFLIGLAGAATAVSVSGSTTPYTKRHPKHVSPCAIVSSMVQNYYNISSNRDEVFKFDAELGNRCLLSSIINKTLAMEYVQEFKKYVQFQTTLSYLKSPPSGYPYPPVDILGGLDNIAAKAAAGIFTSQYAFDQELATLMTSAHEGHLYTSFCTATAILYVRPIDFVSISPDGIQLPRIYILSDVKLDSNISSVALINGKNATTQIEQESIYLTSDPDASYNSMFFSRGRIPSSGSATGQYTTPNLNFFPGVWTNVTFSNGTTIPYKNQAAIIPGTWSRDIVDGSSFTDFFCIAPAQSKPTTSAAESSTTTSATSTPAATKYPDEFPYTPIRKDPNNQVAGYFLNGTGYDDTAVLWVSSFSQENAAYGDLDTIADSFVNTTRDFFDDLRLFNRTKLVIDLSGNPGGNTLLPNDLFRRLFPTIEPYGAGRLRIPTAADIWGQTLARIPGDLVYPTEAMIENGTMGDRGDLSTSSWDYRASLTTNLENITSWHHMFPPNVQNGDNFTMNFRAPINSSFFTEYTDGIDVYGYETDPTQYPQPFPASQVVIVTDGFCASACSIFAEFMTRQANVKTVVVGGRPQNAPMQAIGGTKGSEAFSFDSLKLQSQLILSHSSYIPPDLLPLVNTTFPGVVSLPLGHPSALGSYSVNLRDNIPVGDDAQTPLQFVFEPADCRLFYTAQMVAEQKEVWKRVHDIAWKGAKCAWGGINSTGVVKGNPTTIPPTTTTSTTNIATTKSSNSPTKNPAIQVKSAGRMQNAFVSAVFGVAGIAVSLQAL